MPTCPTPAGPSRPLVLGGRLQVGEAQEDLLQGDLAHGVVIHGVLLLGLLQNTKHLAEAEKLLLTSPGLVRLPEVLPPTPAWGLGCPGGGGGCAGRAGLRDQPSPESSQLRCDLGQAIFPLWASFLFLHRFFSASNELPNVASVSTSARADTVSDSSLEGA